MSGGQPSIPSYPSATTNIGGQISSSGKQGNHFYQTTTGSQGQQNIQNGLTDDFYAENPYIPTDTNNFRSNSAALYNQAQNALGGSNQRLINYGNQLGSNLANAESQQYLSNLTPYLNTLQSDAASRMGTYNSTAYTDGLANYMGQQVAPELGTLTNQAMLQGAQLVPSYQNALSNQYQTLFSGLNQNANTQSGLDSGTVMNSLTGLNQLQQQYMGGLNSVQSLNNQAQTFNNNQFNQQQQLYQDSQNQFNELLSAYGVQPSSGGSGAPSGNATSGGGAASQLGSSSLSSLAI